MEKISIKGREFSCQSSRNRRAKRLILRLKSDGTVALTRPAFVSEAKARHFILEKADWLIEKADELEKTRSTVIKGSHRIDYIKKKAAARLLVLRKIAGYNRRFGFKFGRIAIRNQASCWGSCSRRGNLNFNYKLVYLPEKLADYIIVHELCHLGELNHSEKFWNLVAQVFPEHQALRRELRQAGRGLM